MRIVDLTHTLREEILLWPGTPKPRFNVICNYEKDGFRETSIHVTSHTGTHMDAPAHLFPQGRTLDCFAADQFCGTALVVECTDVKEGCDIGYEYIKRVQTLADKADFLLFWTGWEEYYKTLEHEKHSPGICMEIADYAVASGKKGVGIDTMSIDASDAGELAIHKRILGTDGMVIIENLCNLRLAGKELFDFFALPLKYNDADGSTVRAVAAISN